MKVILVVIFCMVSLATSARDNGQYGNVDPVTREWFLAQNVPRGEHKGTSCCSQADGASAEEDIRNGEYWARFQTCDLLTPSNCLQVEWMQVPDDAVLDGPNKRGVATVWWYVENGTVKIRCYAPGPKA